MSARPKTISGKTHTATPFGIIGLDPVHHLETQAMKLLCLGIIASLIAAYFWVNVFFYFWG